MEVLSVLLYTAAVVIAVLLICLILVQPSKGGGLGSAFGGIGEGVFGAQAMSQLSKVTVWLIAIFFAVTLLLAAVTGHKRTVSSAAAKSSVAGASVKTPVKAAPAAKTPVKAAPAAKTPVKAAPAAKTPAK